MEEILKLFKMIYKNKGDNLILERYTLSKGTYLLVDAKRGNILEKHTIIKNTKNIHKYLKELDYYSRIINTNKGMDLPSRKILSNSFLCFYAKKRVIRNNLITKKNLETYKRNVILNYNSLEKDFKNLKDKGICKYIQENYCKYKADSEVIDDIFYWIEDNINPDIVANAYEANEPVLKVFFIIDNIENTLEFIKQEYYKYLCWNVLDKKDRDAGKLEDAILEYTFKRYLIEELKQKKYYIYITKNNIIASNKLENMYECKYILKIKFDVTLVAEIEQIKKMDF